MTPTPTLRTMAKRPHSLDGLSDSGAPALDPFEGPETTATATTDEATDAAANNATATDPAALDPTTQLLLRAEDDDNQLLKRALWGAVLFHVVLLLVTFPDLSRPEPLREAGPRKVYVVQQVRFQPPAAAPKQEIPKKRTKKIPIPDPTPDDPEPLLIEELEEPAIELADVDVAVFGIPDAPPSVGRGAADGPIYLGAGITPPVKIVSPQPRYTEEARQARIQGTVILQAVIDREGSVGEIQVIKGLPLGLDQSAIDTVGGWQFKPALKGDEPVAVYLNLMINFSLQ